MLDSAIFLTHLVNYLVLQQRLNNYIIFCYWCKATIQIMTSSKRCVYFQQEYQVHLVHGKIARKKMKIFFLHAHMIPSRILCMCLCVFDCIRFCLKYRRQFLSRSRIAFMSPLTTRRRRLCCVLTSTIANNMKSYLLPLLVSCHATLPNWTYRDYL